MGRKGSPSCAFLEAAGWEPPAFLQSIAHMVCVMGLKYFVVANPLDTPLRSLKRTSVRPHRKPYTTTAAGSTSIV